MQQWKKRGDYRSVAEAVQGMSGLTLEELRSPAHVEPETIENLAVCGGALKQWAIQDSLPVVIVGDYDADGITSTAILVKLLRHFGVTPQTIIPRRFTDGYGINEHLIRYAYEEGVDTILTCDNGIAAVEQTKLAKSLGMTILITDHHEVQEEIPPADAVVNPRQADCPYRA